jgi:hypothetical protein
MRLFSSIVTPAEMMRFAKERVSELRALSFVELQHLPETKPESVALRGSSIDVCTYRDTLPDGKIRVIVQAYKQRFLFMGTMIADGFIVAADGSKTEVPEEMMWEFT